MSGFLKGGFWGLFLGGVVVLFVALANPLGDVGLSPKAPQTEAPDLVAGDAGNPETPQVHEEADAELAQVGDLDPVEDTQDTPPEVETATPARPEIDDDVDAVLQDIAEHSDSVDDLVSTETVITEAPNAEVTKPAAVDDDPTPEVETASAELQETKAEPVQSEPEVEAEVAPTVDTAPEVEVAEDAAQPESDEPTGAQLQADGTPAAEGDERAEADVVATEIEQDSTPEPAPEPAQDEVVAAVDTVETDSSAAKTGSELAASAEQPKPVEGAVETVVVAEAMQRRVAKHNVVRRAGAVADDHPLARVRFLQ